MEPGYAPGAPTPSPAQKADQAPVAVRYEVRPHVGELLDCQGEVPPSKPSAKMV